VKVLGNSTQHSAGAYNIRVSNVGACTLATTQVHQENTWSFQFYIICIRSQNIVTDLRLDFQTRRYQIIFMGKCTQ
jgi:hypothetical protein